MKKNNIIIILCSIGILLIFSLGLSLNNQNKNKNIIIYFNSEGGNTIEKKEIKLGESVTLPSISKEGYVFVGWFKGDIKVSNNTKYYETTTLFAQWIKEDAKTFTITFDSDGGSSIEDLIVECNTKLKLPINPTKEGYKFISWIDSYDIPILDDALLACEDITLKAKWEKIEDKKEEKKTQIIKEITYTCPDGYTLNGTKCTITKDTILGCDQKTEIKYNNKCYNTNDYKPATCKIMTELSLEEGKVINIGSNSFKCALTQVSTCGDDHKVQGICYKYVEDKSVSSLCSDYSGYEYIFNAFVNSGCYKGTNLHNICEDDYTLNDNKCVKEIDATIK